MASKKSDPPFYPQFGRRRSLRGIGSDLLFYTELANRTQGPPGNRQRSLVEYMFLTHSQKPSSAVKILDQSS